MTELIKLIETLTADNEYISNYIDRNIELIKTTDIDAMNDSTIEFYKFMNSYVERNSTFKNLMSKHNFNTIWDIPNGDILSEKELSALLHKFDTSVKSSHKKLTLYGQLISGELNMINKIKHFKTSGTIDFKL